MVASVHSPHLRQGHVALVYESNEVLGEIIQQAERPFTLLAAVEITGVILDSGAIPHLLDHLQIVLHPLLETLGFQALAD